MSDTDDPTAWTPQPPNSDSESGLEEYSAERPVNLREQRLRGRDDEAHPALRLRPTPPVHRPPAAQSPRGSSALARDTRGEEPWRRVLAAPAGVDADPAGWGWRGKANALGARLRPTASEISHREAIERIRQPLPGTPVVAVCNTKGGGGTTPAALMLAAIFGTHRHGVVAWDNAESRGTLAARAAHATRAVPTTWDVLDHAAELCSPTVLASALGRFLVAQPTGEEILASDQSSRRPEMIGARECAAILAVLRRHRTMVVIDTGNNDRTEAFGFAIEHATALVIPLTYRRDAAHMVLRTLDALAARGHGELIRHAVVILADGSAVTPAARTAVRDALAAAEITHILDVPFDPDLASGERILTTRLSETSIRAWTRAAAVLADILATTLAGTEPVLAAPDTPESRPVSTEPDPRQVRPREPDHPLWGDPARRDWPPPSEDWPPLPRRDHNAAPGPAVAERDHWPAPGEIAR